MHILFSFFGHRYGFPFHFLPKNRLYIPGYLHVPSVGLGWMDYKITAGLRWKLGEEM